MWRRWPASRRPGAGREGVFIPEITEANLEKFCINDARRARWSVAADRFRDICEDGSGGSALLLSCLVERGFQTPG